MNQIEQLSTNELKLSVVDARQYFKAMLEGDSDARQLYTVTRMCGSVVDEAWVRNAEYQFLLSFPKIKEIKDLNDTFIQILKGKKVRSFLKSTTNLARMGYDLSAVADAFLEASRSIQKADIEYILKLYDLTPTRSISEHLETELILGSLKMGDIGGLKCRFSVVGALIDDYFAVKSCLIKSEEKIALIRRLIPSYDSNKEKRSDIYFSTFDEILKAFFADQFIIDLNHAFEIFSEIVHQNGGSDAELGSAALKYARKPTDSNAQLINEKLRRRYEPLNLSLSKADGIDTDNTVGMAPSAFDIAKQEAKLTIEGELKSLYPQIDNKQSNQISTGLTKLHTKMGVDLAWLLGRMKSLRGQSPSPSDLLTACTNAARTYDSNPPQKQTHHSVEVESAKSLNDALKLLSGAANYKGVNWKTLEGLMDPDEPVSRLSEALGYLVLHRLSQSSKSIKRLNLISQLSGLPCANLLPGVLINLYAKKQIITTAGTISTSDHDQVQLSSDLKSKFL